MIVISRFSLAPHKTKYVLQGSVRMLQRQECLNSIINGPALLNKNICSNAPRFREPSRSSKIAKKKKRCRLSSSELDLVQISLMWLVNLPALLPVGIALLTILQAKVCILGAYFFNLPNMFKIAFRLSRDLSRPGLSLFLLFHLKINYCSLDSHYKSPILGRATCLVIRQGKQCVVGWLSCLEIPIRRQFRPNAQSRAHWFVPFSCPHSFRCGNLLEGSVNRLFFLFFPFLFLFSLFCLIFPFYFYFSFLGFSVLSSFLSLFQFFRKLFTFSKKENLIFSHLQNKSKKYVCFLKNVQHFQQLFTNF